jgi:hypothetical protein
MALRSHAYILDKMRRRVLAGLSPEETFEFELLDAQIPFNGKPTCLSTGVSLSETEHRWLELFEKMESASQFGASRAGATRGRNVEPRKG